MINGSLILSFQFAWMKVKTLIYQIILSLDQREMTRDSRISMVEQEGDWLQLKIKDLALSDQGWYMCQINTNPLVSGRIFLEVKGL